MSGYIILCLKSNLSAFETEVDKLDIPKLATVPVDLSKITKEVQEDLLKKKLMI